MYKIYRMDRKSYEEGYKDGLNADRWISVEDKLPEEEGKYLCIIQNRYERKVEIELFISSVGFISPNKITHWMPLPEMPKGE